jgi:hypothetical protein
MHDEILQDAELALSCIQSAIRDHKAGRINDCQFQRIVESAARLLIRPIARTKAYID